MYIQFFIFTTNSALQVFQIVVNQWDLYKQKASSRQLLNVF